MHRIKPILICCLALMLSNGVGASVKIYTEPENSKVFLNSGEFIRLYKEGFDLVDQNTNRAYAIALDLQRIAIQKNKIELTFLADYFLARCQYFYNQGPKAVSILERLNKIAIDKKWPITQVKIQLYLAAVFQLKRNSDFALQHFEKALELSRKFKLNLLTLESYDKLGFYHIATGREGGVKKSEECFKKGLSLAIKMKDTAQISNFYIRIAQLGDNGAPTDSTVRVLHRAISLAKMANIDDVLVLAYKALGDAYYSRESNDSSLEYYKMVYKIRGKKNQPRVVAVAACDVAYMYGLTGNSRLLDAYADTALMFSKLDRSGESKYYVNKWLAEIYKETGNTNKAFKHYKRYAFLLDSSLKSGSAENMSQAGLQSGFDAKLDFIRLKQRKENEIKEKEKKNQAFLARLYLIGLCAFLLLSIIIFREFRVNKRQKKTIQEQHKNVNEQKLALEVKNKEITDSINYALRIQSALLPSNQDFINTFKGSFVLYQPKDIVSGDFYWYYTKGHFIYVACGDCTGHGVPGALMSVLGINLLNDIVESEKATEPAKILDALRDGVIKSLNKELKSGEYKDGMDISLIKINTLQNTCVFAGAHNSIYHFKGNELIEYKANKQPVGFNLVMNPFTQIEFSFNPGDTLLLFTDGFADQFGELTNKKFTYKRFRELLVESLTNKTNTGEQLTKAFNNWKGKLEQIDDVCVLGLKL